MRTDRGAAAIDFVLVAPLIVGLCCAVIHVGVWVVGLTQAHRMAFEVARQGILAPGGPRASVSAAREELVRRLPGEVDGSVRLSSAGGVSMVSVEIVVPLRVWDWDSPLEWTASAHLPMESR